MIDLKEQAGIAMNVRGQLSEPIADPQVTLGALAFADDLGRLLWRMKYGQDVKQAGLNHATLLLEKRLRGAGRFNRARFAGITRSAKKTAALSGLPQGLIEREAEEVVERFAKRVIVEWVADLCPDCDGRGVRGRGELAAPHPVRCPVCAGSNSLCIDEFHIPFAGRPDGGGPILYREFGECPQCHGAGRVALLPDAKRIGRQICSSCQGSGRSPVDHLARARALCISLERYRSYWAPHFVTVLALLDAVDGAANDTMRRKLQR